MYHFIKTTTVTTDSTRYRRHDATFDATWKYILSFCAGRDEAGLC